MTEEQILDILGQVDDQYITESAPGQTVRSRPRRVKWFSPAAGLPKKSAIALASIILICVIGGTVSAVQGGNIFHLAGQLYASFQAQSSTAGSGDILAKYNGTPITSTVVEYHKRMNIMRTEEAADKYNTDIEIVNIIIENMILLEEAERLGLSATDEEIESMIENTRRAYSLPDGKAMIDEYLEGAGLTFEEYLDAVKEQAPRIIARQKLKDSFGRQYCKEHGLTFTKVNPPAEMIAAQEAYIKDLFEQNKHKIEYFIDVSDAD